MAIIKRKDIHGDNFGSYRISVYKGKDKNGKKLYHWETFDGNKQQALKRETDLKYEVNNGKYIKPGKLSVGAFMDRWLEEWSKPNMAASTHRGFEQQVKNHVKPVLGELLLTSLNKFKISEYYSDRLKIGLSQQTIRHHRTMLHRAFEVAIEWGLITFNPVIGSSKIRVQKPEIETYSSSEANAFLQAARELEPQYYAMFTLSFHAGLRRSELCGLKWKDVEASFTSVSVTRKLFVSDHGQVIFGQTKTRASEAPVVLTATAAAVLKEHYKYSQAAYATLGKDFNRECLVFCHFDTDKPYQPNTVSLAFTRIARKARLKHISLHEARHTMATIMLTQKVHPKMVQERCRHTSIRTTMDLYSHVIPGMHDEAARTLDDALKSGYNYLVNNKADCQ